MASAGATGTVPSRQSKKLMEGLAALIANPLPFVKDPQLQQIDGINELFGVLIGPDGSNYAGSEFKFLMRFPVEYPFKPPDFFFITAISHPNVDEKTGVACHDQLLATWAPSIKLHTLLTEMHSLLAKPNYDSPINGKGATDKGREEAQ